MIAKVITLAALYTVAECSGVTHGIGAVAAVVQGGPVLAASSQYFERTFNRLVVPPAPEPVIPVAPPPPVLVQPVSSAAVPVLPVDPTVDAPASIQPNIAIAVATAHAAAPVATILLPPYPFGPPPTIGFIPPNPPINVPDDERKESTTQQTIKTEVRTTPREPEPTTPLPSNSNNNVVQALPSNENVNFRQYYAPLLPPQPPKPKPQKLKTSVEIVPVPLQYISPPPLVHHHHQHTSTNTIKHVHTYVPAKIIIRPVSSPFRIKSVRRPVRIVKHKTPLIARTIDLSLPRNVGPSRSRDIEPITFRPFIRQTTRPPRV